MFVACVEIEVDRRETDLMQQRRQEDRLDRFLSLADSRQLEVASAAVKDFLIAVAEVPLADLAVLMADLSNRGIHGLGLTLMKVNDGILRWVIGMCDNHPQVFATINDRAVEYWQYRVIQLP